MPKLPSSIPLLPIQHSPTTPGTRQLLLEAPITVHRRSGKSVTTELVTLTQLPAAFTQCSYIYATADFACAASLPAVETSHLVRWAPVGVVVAARH
ncbi:uncharacterized protein LAJ45_01094 [Morchella importuna]|uniref:uncharacterized protein n=1 Tax=Morchella importuna TaxID=1174673 RepID=UPI001E8E0C20|nr:uncharacterized protein LAJ45_01094 [Morchella importuna]KAH8154566.1 hypothetical protein LAJ45_01094 [Morchella importuna]